MNSLVGYGLSSDSESEGDGDDGIHGGTASTGSEVCSRDTAVKKNRNFLLESNSASSESESDSESSEAARAEPSAPAQKRAVAAVSGSAPSRPAPRGPPLPSPPNKLPPPPLSACAGSSVFANPFKIQADEKLSVLQKHVPLTLQAKPSQIGGKRMCVAYRKDGRCRFGIKCKFAHDSDLQTAGLPGIYGHSAGDDDDTQGSERLESRVHHHHRPCDGEPQGDGETEEQQGRKRRVGLSNTLIPPKRAMKQFARQRDREGHHHLS